MASRSVSPGGALLRASRVFSIPPPLPRPSEQQSAAAIFGSDTATNPYPTHLAITTPQTSLARGDWGFKRPLPLRSTTRTSTPFIRIEAIDTFEHITEFGSSADHALTLRKWQELELPVTAPVAKKRDSNYSEHRVGKSVFEDSIDSTVHPEHGSGRTEAVRWKFNGPWLAGQDTGEFNEYIRKVIRNRKVEFRQFLRSPCAASLTQEARKSADGPDEESVAIRAEDVTDEQLTTYMTNLRKDRSELYKQIRDFLDLAPAPTNVPKAAAMEDWLNRAQRTGSEDVFRSEDNAPVSESPYAEGGPPKTHPSAGLSYLRTSQQLFNHPEFGPQQDRPPVKARVVMPKGASTGNFQPVLGVGGFVVEVPEGSAFKTSRPSRFSRQANTKPTIPGLINIDPNVVGGSKTYVKPRSATVDSRGKINLVVGVAEEEAVAVKEGTTASLPRVDRPQKPPSYVREVLNEKSRLAAARDGPVAPRSTGSYGLSSLD